jgi:hypothetical protein
VVDRPASPALRVLFSILLTVGCAACSRAQPVREALPADAWIVTDDGVGRVRLGMSRSQLTARGGAVNSESEACEFVIPQGAPPGVRAMVVDGAVRRIDIAPPGVATRAGVGVGSTESQVTAAYPSARVEPHKYTSGHYLLVDLTPAAIGTRRLVFETDGSTVTRYRVGLVPQVDWVEGCG